MQAFRLAHRLSAACAVALIAAFPATATETLRILTWPGYADADLVRAFEKRFDARVEVSFVASDDILREKISANDGADFDVFAANTAEMQRYIEQRLVQALQLSNIPNTVRQLPRFRKLAEIAGTTHDGEVYAIPYTYSEMGLIYDRRQLREAPDSLAVLWDPRYKGRILAFDGSSHNFSLAAMVAGGPPFRLGEREFRQATERLIALRRNVLTFYALPEESVELFRSHSVAILFANYGSQQLKQLRDAGADVGYVIPREGALAWLDCWAVTRGAKNKRLAESWINYTLETAVSGELTRRQGLANTVEASPSAGDADKIVWLEPVEDAARRTSLWRRILSGDQPARF